MARPQGTLTWVFPALLASPLTFPVCSPCPAPPPNVNPGSLSLRLHSKQTPGLGFHKGACGSAPYALRHLLSAWLQIHTCTPPSLLSPSRGFSTQDGGWPGAGVRLPLGPTELCSRRAEVRGSLGTCCLAFQSVCSLLPPDAALRGALRPTETLRRERSHGEGPGQGAWGLVSV